MAEPDTFWDKGLDTNLDVRRCTAWFNGIAQLIIGRGRRRSEGASSIRFGALFDVSSPGHLDLTTYLYHKCYQIRILTFMSLRIVKSFSPVRDALKLSRPTGAIWRSDSEEDPKRDPQLLAM